MGYHLNLRIKDNNNTMNMELKEIYHNDLKKQIKTLLVIMNQQENNTYNIEIEVAEDKDNIKASCGCWMNPNEIQKHICPECEEKEAAGEPNDCIVCRESPICQNIDEFFQCSEE